MARSFLSQRLMQRFARWHIWLGWLVGVPVLMWTLTGLLMALYPIDEVRGDQLRAAPPPIDAAGLVFPAERIGPLTSAQLVAQVDGPVWIVTEPDGGRYRYSARDGSLVPPVIESEAIRIAEQVWTGEAALEGVGYFPADASPGLAKGPAD